MEGGHANSQHKAKTLKWQVSNQTMKEMRFKWSKLANLKLMLFLKTQLVRQENVVGRLQNLVPIFDISRKNLMRIGLDSPIPSPTHSQRTNKQWNRTRIRKGDIMNTS